MTNQQRFPNKKLSDEELEMILTSYEIGKTADTLGESESTLLDISPIKEVVGGFGCILLSAGITCIIPVIMGSYVIAELGNEIYQQSKRIKILMNGGTPKRVQDTFPYYINTTNINTTNNS